MFDEISSESAEYRIPRQRRSETSFPNDLHDLTSKVSEVLLIEKSQIDTKQAVVIAQFVGELQLPAADAYEILDAQLEPADLHAQFRNEPDGKQSIYIARGRYNPEPRSWTLNAILLVLTVFSTMLAGAVIDGSVESLDELVMGGFLRGFPYAFSLMLILGAHELGHYFAARHHNVSVTLPYFIPLPIGLFGTLGAFIQLREPMLNRKQLFDIGVSGPLAGMVFAVPILLIGIATANVSPLPTEEDCRADEGACSYILEGNSVFYATAKYILKGEFLPNDVNDLSLNQLAFAGWTGLFVTGLNLLPVGQLDGGHILYSLIGRHAQRLYLPALLGMGVLALINQGWILWVILLFFFGRVHAVPLEDITPLDPMRRAIGIFALVTFFFIFTPSPFEFVSLME